MFCSSKNKRVVLGMSGGVDSSAALILLKNKGFDVIGVSLKLPIWKSKENLLRENICCTKESIEIAKMICKKFKVPHYEMNVKSEFKKIVIDYFIKEFKKFRTPNPCVICNRYLKFKKLFEFAKKIDAKYVATGHYARIRYNKKLKRYQLLIAKDKTKDQTYNLCLLPSNWLEKIIFPIGEYTKEEVYKIVENKGLDFFYKKPQSQDFCFVAGKSIHRFLEKNIGKKKGLIVDTNGKILGTHKGLYFYTIGQRKGIKLPKGPFWVKKYDTKKNLLIVTKNRKDIFQKELFVKPFNFISIDIPKTKLKIKAKVRAYQNLGTAILYPPKNNKIKVVFNIPQFAITKGQVCAFYKSNICLGGGIIF